MAGIDKEFDYLVPEGSPLPSVGTELRVNLSGRAVGGWVTARGVEPPPGVALRPYGKVRGSGPEPEVVELAGWAAWRWASRRSRFLRSASSERAVTRLPSPALRRPRPPGDSDRIRAHVPELTDGGVHLLRLPPAADPTALVADLAQRGPLLVIVPAASRAAVLAGRLRRAGGQVALVPDDWAQARVGAAVVIGARSAAWAPCPGLRTVLVLDAHEEALGREGVPTWHAVDVAVERSRRAGCACVLVSPCPTPELLALGPVATVDRTSERRGWGVIEVLDRRQDDPRLGLYSERLVGAIREQERVLCILNRTGRSRLLACGACGSLARCEVCGRAVSEKEDGQLDCPGCGTSRPKVCPDCGSTWIKLLRIGVSRAREDLEALAGRHVGELTAATKGIPPDGVIVGTEAALHRLSPADGLGAVVFLDFDQELLAPRVRAAEQALAFLATASRLVRGAAGRIIVQTRIPDHPVIQAAVAADPEILSDSEADLRRDLQLPPFWSVAVVTGAGSGNFASAVRSLPGSPVGVLGPDGDRWLLKAPDPVTLSDALAGLPRPGTVRVAVDPARL